MALTSACLIPKMSSSSSSYDSELETASSTFHIPDIDDDMFQHEPMPGAMFARFHRERDEDEEQQSTDIPQLVCSCGECQEWVGIRNIEKRCCQQIAEARHIMAEANMESSCLTAHPDFDTVCFNATIHKITRASFDRRERSQCNRMEQHRQRRYIAYCNMSRWLYGRTGRGNRVPLCVCVVRKIRAGHPPPLVQSGIYSTETYPDFTGFRDAPQEDMEDEEGPFIPPE